MATLLVLSGLLGLLAAVVHGGLGDRVILRPTLAAALPRLVQAAQHGAWHVITWHFAVLGVASLVAAWLPAPAATAIAWVVGASAVGHAAVMFATGWRYFGDPWHLPQWALFVPMAACSLGAPHADAIPPGTAPAVAAAIAAALFSAIAGLHVAWAAGSPFPARDRDALVASVVGAPIGSPMPGRVATLVVAIGLVSMAWWTAAQGGLVPSPVPAPWLRAGSLAMVVIFGLRGIGGFFELALRPAIRGTPYVRYSRIVYSPLALLLAALVVCAML
jgi:hypothetical protein